MNRGSALCRKPCCRRAARFNEAPIHESGKFRRRLIEDQYHPVLQ